MDILRDIAYVLTRYQVRQVEVLTNAPSATAASDAKRENRYREFYEGLRDGLWKSETEAAQHFGFEPESKAFTRFKNDLKKRLYNTVLFIDVNLPDYGDLNRANHQIMLEWVIADIMARKGARKAAKELAHKALQYAIRFENLGMIVQLAKLLKSMTQLQPHLAKDYQHYQSILTQYWPAYQAEMKAQMAFDDLIFPLINIKGYRKEYAATAEKIAEEIRPDAEKYPFVTLQMLYRNVVVYSKTLAHDWQGALEHSVAALEFFKKKSFVPNLHLIVFATQQIGCLIMLGHHERAKEVIADLLELTGEATPSWFKTHELATVNLMYMGDYMEAWKITRQITRHPRFDTIGGMDQESWRIYQGYLHFLAKTGKIQLSSREKGDANQFRHAKLLNELPLYNQDKRGANIPTLILQTLFLLLEDRPDEFDNRVEALRKYRQRNLDPNDEHFRTNCFIRLLELISRARTNLPEIRRESAKLLDKMKTVSADILDRSFELEVVPYERQWDWFMEILDGSRHVPLPQQVRRLMLS